MPAEFLALLLQRERRLRELTEQCLALLDRQAELQLGLSEVDALQARCRKLESELVATRRHLRAGRARLIGRVSQAGELVDVVLWPVHQLGREDLARWMQDAAPDLAASPEVSALDLLCTADREPQIDELPPRGDLLQIDGFAPPRIWNLALAASDAELVLFLGPGVRAQAPIPGGTFAPLRDPLVALAQLPFQAGDAPPTLGYEDSGHLDLKPLPARDDAAWIEIGFVEPSAFVVRRDAWSQLGGFDEDLHGIEAVHEFALRAHAQGLRVLGRGGPGFVRPPGVVVPAPFAQDRFVILARHRPIGLGGALAGYDELWSMPPDDRRAFLRAVFARVAGVDAGAQLLGDIVVDLVGRTISGPKLAAIEAWTRDLHRQIELQADARNQAEQRASAADAARQDAERERSAVAAELERTLGQIAGMAQAARELETRTAQLEQHAAMLQDLLNQERSHAKELEADLIAARTEHRAQERRVTQLEAELRHRREEFDDLQRTAEQRRGELTVLNAALGLPASTPLPDVARHVATQIAELAGHERWIVELLRELTQRSGRSRPRALTDAEQRFLAQHEDRNAP